MVAAGRLALEPSSLNCHGATVWSAVERVGHPGNPEVRTRFTVRKMRKPVKTWYQTLTTKSRRTSLYKYSLPKPVIFITHRT